MEYGAGNNNNELQKIEALAAENVSVEEATIAVSTNQQQQW